MIVVIGSPILRHDPATASVAAAGLAGRIALAAAAANRTVQLVGKVGDDDSGDALLIALASGGVSHAAILRDATNATPTIHEAQAADDDPFPADDDLVPAPLGLPLEAADIGLALRYLADFQVVVLAAPLDALTLETALESAGFVGAHVIRLDGGDPGEGVTGLEMTAFEAPVDDEPAFAAMVGQYAAGLDAGRAPRDAFTDATRGTNWERAPDH